MFSYSFYTYFLCFTFVLVVHIILSLIITVVIATLTLVESNVLSLVQRSVGPHYVGYRGRLQFIADALNLLLNGITVPDLTNNNLFVLVPASALFISYNFWVNTLWGPSLSLVEIEYNVVYLGVMSIFFSLCIILTGIFSRNNFSVLAAVSSCSMMLNLEIMLGFLFLFIVSINESFSFAAATTYQYTATYTLFALAPLLPFIILIFLLDTNSSPFDLAEAESELVAGYTTELGGFFFALYYLGEYFHLYFFSFTFAILFLGAWF